MKIDRRSFLERFAIGLLFSTSGLPVLAQSYKPEPEKFRLNKKWLRNDVAAAADVTQILSETPRELNQFLDRFSPYGVREDRYTGFGLRQLHLAKGPGYTSIFMNIVAQDQKILALECVQTANGNDWPFISSEILKAWNRPPIQNPEPIPQKWTAVHVIFQQYIDRTKLAETLAGTLGPAPIPSSLSSYEESFNLLRSPFEILYVGVSCGNGGEKPAGRVATEHLSEAKRFDLLRATLRGPNPEGRTYAALALQRNGQVTSDDAAVIIKLSALDVPIYSCMGCRLSRKTFADIIQDPKAY